MPFTFFTYNVFIDHKYSHSKFLQIFSIFSFSQVKESFVKLMEMILACIRKVMKLKYIFKCRTKSSCPENMAQELLETNFMTAGLDLFFKLTVPNGNTI